MVHQDGMEYGESHCPKCYDSQAGLADEPTKKGSYGKQFDESERVKDAEQNAL